MKRATFAALAILALMIPPMANAQDAAAKLAAAKTLVTAKLAATVDGSGKAAPTPCNVIDAADYVQAQEAACDAGLGYMILPGAAGPQALTCAALVSSDADIDSDGLISACGLPENRDPMAMIDKVLKDSKTVCTPVARGFVGETDTGSGVYFEVVCDSGQGYLIQVWKDHSDKIQVDRTWTCDPTTKTVRGISCDLTKLGVEGARAAEAKRVALLNAYYAPPKPAAPAPAAAKPAAPAAPAAGRPAGQ